MEKSLDVAIIATGPYAKSIIDTKTGGVDSRGTGRTCPVYQKGGKKALPDLSRICSTLGKFLKCLSLGRRGKVEVLYQQARLRGVRQRQK